MSIDYNTILLKGAAGPKKPLTPVTATQEFAGTIAGSNFGSATALSGDSLTAIFGENLYTGVINGDGIDGTLESTKIEVVGAGSTDSNFSISGYQAGDIVIVSLYSSPFSTPNGTGWTLIDSHTHLPSVSQYNASYKRELTGDSLTHDFSSGSGTYLVVRNASMDEISGTVDRVTNIPDPELVESGVMMVNIFSNINPGEINGYSGGKVTSASGFHELEWTTTGETFSVSGMNTNSVYALHYILINKPVEEFPRAFAISDDGLTAFTSNTTAVTELTLSSAWDISTANNSANNTTFIPTISGTIESIDFSSNGSILYIGSSSEDVYSFDLSSEWDLSGLSSTPTHSFDVSNEVANLVSITVSDADDKFLVLDSNATVYEYDMVSGNVASMSYSGGNLDVSNETSNTTMTDISLENGGTSLFVGGTETHSYTLGTADTVNSAIYDEKFFRYPNKLTGRYGNSGEQYYMVNTTGDITHWEVPASYAYDLDFLEVVANQYDNIGAVNIYKSSDGVLESFQRVFKPQDANEEGTLLDVSNGGEIVINLNGINELKIYKLVANTYNVQEEIFDVYRPKICPDGNVVAWTDFNTGFFKSATSSDDGVTWTISTITESDKPQYNDFFLNRDGSAVVFNDGNSMISYARSGTAWSHVSTAPLNTVDDAYSMAGSIDGNTLVISGFDNDVNVLRRDASSNTAWTYVVENTLTTVSGASLVDMNHFGNIAVIGESGATVGGIANSGQVFLYTKYGNNWTLEATLDADDFGGTEENGYFGYSVSINSIGNEILIGAPGMSNGQGAIYRYTY